ncbi:PAS domain-containing sensor histidine kinase [Hyphococcus luteus]|uniref:histidine kinase n=1 Tax=Hyphococcus luteus TaxID=2058213 RepID=A0A2S7KA53_9PROT|nr:PAS domain-containing hybrid sensor histidine kinase/response regulator [Marinicaulis flavus]PQA89382.1 hypothetical protein CW354_00450 [Marinicaulis flavus]
MLTVFIISFAAAAALYGAAVALVRRAQGAGASRLWTQADFLYAGVLFGLAPLIAFELTAAPYASPDPSAAAAHAPLFWAAGIGLFAFAGVCSVQIFRRYRLNPLTLMAAALVYALLAMTGFAAVLAAAFDDIRNAVTIAAIGAAPLSFLLHWLVFVAGRRAGALGAGAALAAVAGLATSYLGARETVALFDAARAEWLAVWAVLMLAALRPPRRGNAAETHGSLCLEDLPADLMAFILDTDDHVQSATPAAKSFFRLEPSLPQGCKAPLLTPLSADEAGSLCGAGAARPCCFIDRAGVEHYVRLHERRIEPEKGPAMRLMVAEPIDDLIEQEKRRRRLNHRMISVIDANDDMLLFVSASGLVTDLNRCALQFLKKARKECVSEYVWNLFPQTENAPSGDAWREFLNNARRQESVRTQAVLASGEGKARLFKLNISKIENDGADPEFLCFCRDITEITQARKSFQEAQSRLEQTIANRTRELQDAKKAADNANLSKSRFLANMSHELRTPLNAILGYTDLMLQDLADDGKQGSQEYQDLDRVVVNARNLLNLINDILDLSKVEANKMTLSYSDVSVEEFVDDIRASVDPLVTKRGNILAVDIAEELSSVVIDRQKVSQCLLNLLSNAAKFTEGGEISLKLWMNEDGGAPMIYFEVCDTGKGMTPQQCEAIFDEFVQVEEAGEQNTGGTGLGLPIARRFCQLMGGDIVATSAPGAGSRFTMWVRNGAGNAAQTEEDAA